MWWIIAAAVVFSLFAFVMIRGRKWVDDIGRTIDEAFREAQTKDLE